MRRLDRLLHGKDEAVSNLTMNETTLQKVRQIIERENVIRVQQQKL